MKIIHRLWDFGDGFFSTEENPVHEYLKTGYYTVSLTEWYDDGLAETEIYGPVRVGDGETVSEVPVNTCLRYATQMSNGEGWSEYNNAHWVLPLYAQGVIKIRHDRVVVLDVDHKFYQIDTGALDKAGVQDAEIAWEKHGREEEVGPSTEHKHLQHDESHVGIRPEDPADRGASGYTATGQRNAQKLSLELYRDGERVTPIAVTNDFPEDGDVVFSGYHGKGQSMQLVLKGTAGEIEVTEINHSFIGDLGPGSVAQRTMQEHTIQSALMGDKLVHLSRGSRPLTNLRTGTVVTGTVTQIAGPDGRTYSAMQIDADVNLGNAASTGYTVILWSKTGAPGPISGLAMTEYTNDGTWYLLYATGAGALPANLVLPAGTSEFDPRVYSVQLSNLVADVLPYYHRDVTQNEGVGLLPS